MDELNLKVDYGDETSMPTAVLEGSLTFAEIGALFFMIAVGEGDRGMDHPRLADPAVLEILRGLKDKGIVEIETQGNKVHISVNIDAAVLEDDDKTDDTEET